MLSGVLALIGGGMVNVNIQMASLKERVREVGVKMAIGASGREVFKGFMTEALLLTVFGTLPRLWSASSSRRSITASIGVPLSICADELRLGRAAGRRLRLPLRPLPGLEGEPPLADGGAAL